MYVVCSGGCNISNMWFFFVKLKMYGYFVRENARLVLCGLSECHPSRTPTTPRQTPHFDTKSEIYPSRTLVKNEIMKTCTKHRKSCEKIHMALFFVRDGLSQHASPIFHSPKLAKGSERFRRLVLRSTSHSKQCHMHI